jgi:hypothetical protein
MLDVSKPLEEQWKTIDAELAAYGAGLDALPQIVVLNKIDLLPDRPVSAFPISDPRIVATFALSCATGEGIDEFRRRLFALVPESEAAEPAGDELADFLVYKPEPKARPWHLLRTDSGFRVVGTPDPGELDRALRAAGARPGAEVEMGGETLELV